MTRLCLIGPASNIHLQRWAQGLNAQGFQVSILSTTPVGEPQPAMLCGLPVLALRTATARLSRRQRLTTLLHGWARVPGLLAGLKPDLVHLHALPSPAAVPFLLPIKRLIVSPWGSDVVQRDRRKERLYPVLLAHATAVTAVSHYLAEVISSYLRTPRPIQVVPFGVDTEVFTPGKARPAAAKVGTLRHLERIYGIDVLIASWPTVKEQHPAATLHIGGNGTLWEELQHQVKALRVSEHVFFRGQVPFSSVPNFLRTLDVFVMPSRSESLGVAALEAQACGVPVVASQVGGLPEVIAANTTGLLVPSDEPAALAQAITALLDDPQRCAAMGQAGRCWVQEQYSWRASVEKMLHVYERALCGTS